MKLSIHQTNFMDESRQMIGWVLRQVDYTEVDYYPAHPQPCYATDHPQIHTVDFSVRLYFTNDKTVEISWKSYDQVKEEYNAYGLNISLNTGAQKGQAGQRTWNVSDENSWKEIVGQEVQDVRIYWTKAWIETPQATKELNLLYPQAIVLSFANQKTMFISIAEFQAGNLHKVVRGANNLLVTTDESLARQTNMLAEEANAI
ncbi:MAG TPA: hypothetical protein VGN63_04730 [Flavisolibacter sp.]|jgi:hypothetical protein|nr:hypothetical protein [Flavisolibacter sp.]